MLVSCFAVASGPGEEQHYLHQPRASSKHKFTSQYVLSDEMGEEPETDLVSLESVDVRMERLLQRREFLSTAGKWADVREDELCPGHPHILRSSPTCQHVSTHEARKEELCPGHPHILRSSPTCQHVRTHSLDDGHGHGSSLEKAAAKHRSGEDSWQQPQQPQCRPWCNPNGDTCQESACGGCEACGLRQSQQQQQQGQQGDLLPSPAAAGEQQEHDRQTDSELTPGDHESVYSGPSWKVNDPGLDIMPSEEVQDRMADASAMAYREHLEPPYTVCSSSLQPGKRLLLTAFVAEGFHGSTALQQALMSARYVGTLCGGDNWECEAVIDQRRCDDCNKFDRPASALPCIACAAAPRSVHNATEAFRTNLELFEPYWMAQPTKPVLVVKWAPLWPGNAQWDVLGGGVESTPGFDLEEIETATVPRGMAASRVDRVSWGIIIMHRPWCMWNMSSHARTARKRNLRVWAVRELFYTERLIAHYRKLALDHVPVLVTSYAQLLWRPDEFVMRVRFPPGACGDQYPARASSHDGGTHLLTHACR